MAAKINLLTKIAQFALIFLILTSCNVYKIHTVKVDTTEPANTIKNRKNPIILVHNSAIDTMFKITDIKIENSVLSGVLVPADSLVKSYYSQAIKYKKVGIPRTAIPKCNQVHLYTQNVDLKDSTFVQISYENLNKMEVMDYDSTASTRQSLVAILLLGFLGWAAGMIFLAASGVF